MSIVKPVGAQKKVPAGVLAILLGGLGIHKFILGYTKEGVIMLLATLIGSIIHVIPLLVAVVGFVEGIIYLVTPDETFSKTYIEGKKGWF